MPLLLDDADGKSEATLLVEGLVEAMMQQYEAVKEAFRIPLGVQEVTMDGFRKWWRGADYKMRISVIRQYGLEAVLRMLGPVVGGR